MSDHATGHPDGQRACDELLDALREILPGTERKHAKAMCAMHQPGQANFAYVYHTKTKPRLQIWFPSLSSEQFSPLRSVQPVIRSKLGTPWADQWAWHFEIASAEQAKDGAEFLYPFGTRGRRSKTKANATMIAEEVEPSGASFVEGSVARILVNRYERDPKARKRCIEYYGAKCHVCGFAFDSMYGNAFKGLITVHHITPLSTTRAQYVVDPINDLVPLCANCHLIVHQRSPPYSTEEVRQMLPKAGK